MNLEWQMLTSRQSDSKFVAHLIIHELARYPITIIIVCANEDSYTTIPFKDFSFLEPREVSYKEADDYVLKHENVDNMTEEEFLEARLAYACTKFEEDFRKQLNQTTS